MKAVFIVFLLIPLSSAVSQTVEIVNSDHTCEDYAQIVQDYIDFELAGARWQGGDPTCVKNLKLKSMSSEKMKLPSDPSLRIPKYILVDGREVRAEIKRDQDDMLNVKIAYIGRSPASQSDIQVKDSFRLKLNFGHARDTRGCASIFIPPENLVMKQKCWKD